MIFRTITLLFFLILLQTPGLSQVGQIAIGRLSTVAGAPSPYVMRDWKTVATKYDSLVYNNSLSGQYMPFIYLQTGGINYPNQEKFGLHTFVGTKSPLGNEAINVLPSLVGASLAGIDKSNQFGKNWVKMSYDFFNKANGENIYLNNAGGNSGNDWWYDVMPNVYFYQLYDLYDGLDGTGKEQFNSIAQQFSKAIRAMGGSDKPWTQPNMNYRAWKFKTMEPLQSGVTEPEAAGAMAWVLYNAWLESGNEEFLKASEWSMEFLNTRLNNPSYELQLPYGVYTAARMNAELNTDYDIEKMVNWCFDKGPLRGWGCIKGKWGGLDVTGLIGEANDGGNDYAFQMNGLHQAAALVPMTRYDKRFAKDIAKWVLHLANANRLFYHGFLPSDQQDASTWSAQYDNNRVLGYEALRQVWQTKSPFSTGDALKSGWSATNLALYGTSSIGYLGSIIEKTNVEKILKLDLLKTSFFHDAAYPTYLLYNPNATAAVVELQLGSQETDIYEALSEKFIAKSKSGITSINIPPNEAVMLVYCPAGGSISFIENRMMVNGIIIDYGQSQMTYSIKPRIQALVADSNVVEQKKTVNLYCKAIDRDSPLLSYRWSVNTGKINGSGTTVDFEAAEETGEVEVRCITDDETGLSDTATYMIQVVEKINTAPKVPGIQKDRSYVEPGAQVRFWCEAEDEEGDPLQYEWKAEGISLGNGSSEIFWQAPGEGNYTITVAVSDGLHTPIERSVKMLVKTFGSETYNALAYYDFSGNANDKSGNELNGTPKGVILTADRNAKTLSAYYFNGGNQHIVVPNQVKLNFTQGISVCAWFKPISQPEKETFLVSHGSWQERWKLSITQEKKLRWTLNTVNGITDLDAATDINNDTYYHVCASYDKKDVLLFVNGQLESFKNHSGALRTTQKAMTIGQMNADIADYNFKGVIDEVVIYDQMISPKQVSEVYEQGVINAITGQSALPIRLYPNPTFTKAEIQYDALVHALIKAEIFDITGKKVMLIQLEDDQTTLDLSQLTEGFYTLFVYHSKGKTSLPFLKM
ncbi:MAG: T9SS type A sorting domain-containing protein [Saprospiraceae bacterium]|nr:T9SS type A sorting domain-containing protein [Saprospiraceae bacterium]